MADLEELGYLVQPHTSAGRVPTDTAYRFYVDHLQRVPWVAGKAPAVGHAARRPTADAVERLMAETPARLSADTHMMGVLLAPPLKHTALDRIELVALDEERALAVLVTETGWVTARPLDRVAPGRRRGAARDRPGPHPAVPRARPSRRSSTSWPRPPIRSIRCGRGAARCSRRSCRSCATGPST